MVWKDIMPPKAVLGSNVSGVCCVWPTFALITLSDCILNSRPSWKVDLNLWLCILRLKFLLKHFSAITERAPQNCISLSHAHSIRTYIVVSLSLQWIQYENLALRFCLVLGTYIIYVSPRAQSISCEASLLVLRWPEGPYPDGISQRHRVEWSI